MKRELGTLWGVTLCVCAILILIMSETLSAWWLVMSVVLLSLTLSVSVAVTIHRLVRYMSNNKGGK